MLIDRIMSDRPRFHRGETEVLGDFDPKDSILPEERSLEILAGELRALGIGRDALDFISKSVNAETRSLEIGAGYTTLVFAASGSTHFAITPSRDESSEILSYAAGVGIDFSKVTFINQLSEHYLPKMDEAIFDVILLDGKHAFPWPMLDWFFTADHLRINGFMIVDDAQIPAVKVLGDFLRTDPRWCLAHDFQGKTLVFEKLVNTVHDVAWHMQPFNRIPKKSRWTPRRIIAGIRRRLLKVLK